VCQYGEFRKGFRLASGHDEADKRIVAYGIRYIVENYLERRWTLADVEAAAHFYRCVACCAPSAQPPERLGGA
jgi:nicotinamide phosphoribosyltransferase